jgi:plastocyanin
MALLSQVKDWIDDLNNEDNSLGTKQYLLAHEIAHKVTEGADYTYNSTEYGVDGQNLPLSPYWPKPQGETGAPIIAYWTDTNGNKSLKIISYNHVPDTTDTNHKSTWNRDQKYGLWIRKNGSNYESFSIEATYDHLDESTQELPPETDEILYEQSGASIHSLDSDFSSSDTDYDYVFIKGEVKANAHLYKLRDNRSNSYTWIKGNFELSDFGDPLALHYDASNLSASNSLSSWEDLSGNSKNLVQSNTSLRPSVSSSIQINSLNTVVFDDASDKSLASAAITDAISNENFSFFSVFKKQTDWEGVPFIDLGTSEGRFTLTLGASNQIGVRMGSVYHVITDYNFSTDTDYYIEVQRIGAEDKFFIRVNGSIIYESKTYKNSVITDGSLKVSGDIAVGEIAFIQGIVTDDQRNFIDGYFCSKWGLLDSLPSDHIHYNSLTSNLSENFPTESSNKDFTPYDIINEVIQWYDASTLSGLSDSDVSTFNDLSKNNYHLTSRDSSLIRLKTSSLNGLNIIEGIGSYLETLRNTSSDTSLRVKTPKNGSFAMSFVFKFNSISNKFESLLSYDAEPSAAQDFQLDCGNIQYSSNIAASSRLFFRDQDLSNANIYNDSGKGANSEQIPVGDWQIYTVVLDSELNVIKFFAADDDDPFIRRANTYGCRQYAISSSNHSGDSNEIVRIGLSNPDHNFQSEETSKYHRSSNVTVTGDGTKTLKQLFEDSDLFKIYKIYHGEDVVLNSGFNFNFQCKRIASYTDFALFGNRGENKSLRASLAEFIAYEDVSFESISKVRGYLAHKWGLTSLLSSNDAYLSYKPTSFDTPGNNIDLYIVAGGNNANGLGGSNGGISTSLSQDAATRYEDDANPWLDLDYIQDDILFECRHHSTANQSNTSLSRVVDTDSGGGPGRMVPGYTTNNSNQFGLEIPFLDILNHTRPNRIGLLKYFVEDALIGDFNKDESRTYKSSVGDVSFGDLVEVIISGNTSLNDGDIAEIFSIDSANNKITLVEASYSNGTWSTGGSDYSLAVSAANTSSSVGYTFTGSDENGSFNDTDNNPSITMTLGDTLTIDLSSLGSSHPLVIKDASDNTVATEDSDRKVRFAPTTASGDYYYICTSHPSSMRGTINVQTNSNVSFNEYALDGRGAIWDFKKNAWDGLVRSITEYLRSLTDNGLKANFKGIIWSQGEEELSNSNYQSQLSNFIGDIRSWIGNNTLPIKLVQAQVYSSNASDSTADASLSTFKGYQNNLASSLTNVSVLSTADYVGSSAINTHLNSDGKTWKGLGLIKIGKALANSFGDFSPSDISDVKAWYSLKDDTNLTVNSNNITAIDNLIGSNGDLTVNGTLPFSSNSGKGYAEFSASSSTSFNSATSSSDQFSSLDSKEFDIFAVVSHNEIGITSEGTSNLLSDLTSASRFQIAYPYYDSANYPKLQIRTLDSSGGALSNTLNLFNSSPSWYGEGKQDADRDIFHVITISRRNISNSSDNFDALYTIRKNGKIFSTYRVAESIDGSNVWHHDGIRIGGGNFNLGELIISSKLSEKELHSIEGYLAHNWGINNFSRSHNHYTFSPSKL